MRLLSGPTFAPSTLQLGVAEWIALLPVSPARISVSLADALGLTESEAACSSRLSASPPTAVRGSCFWRTSQASLLPPPPLWTLKKASSTKEQPPASWENWPTSGGMRSGSLWPRPTWVPATGALDGSASPGVWPTPTVEIDQGRSATLNSQATATWMTPSVVSATGQQYNRDGGIKGKERPALTGQAMTLMANHWPTPVASDHKSQLGGGMKDRMATRTQSPSLSQVVTHSHSLPQDQPTLDGLQSSPVIPTSPRHLNPLFGGWLMGWRSTWVIAEPHASSALATVLWRHKQQQHLSCLFGEPCATQLPEVREAA